MVLVNGIVEQSIDYSEVAEVSLASVIRNKILADFQKISADDGAANVMDEHGQNPSSRRGQLIVNQSL
ncbi:hypothetical protein TNCV_406611 [Trichonephila clavipes]|nr:hypothetical protein TNCV_406611 [Trichonephila clavipes]